MNRFALWGTLAAVSVLASAAAAEIPKVGTLAPDFRTTTFDGKVVTLKDLRGKVVLVNFWATWCGPCKTELPLLDAYYKVRKDAGLAAIAVTTEDSIPVENLNRLAKAMNMPMAYRFKGKGYRDSEAVPMNFVIDKAGVIRYAEAGSFTLESLERVVLPLLNEPAPDGAPAAVAANAKAAAR